MTMKKIEALKDIMNDLPTAEHSAIYWLERMGIDDDTTADDLDRYETLLFGLDKFQKKILFAVLDVKAVNDLEQFEQIVDDVQKFHWVLDEEITSVSKLHYFIKHDYEEKPDEKMTHDELLCGDDAPTLGQEKLEEQKRQGTGGLSCYGWVSYSA